MKPIPNEELCRKFREVLLKIEPTMRKEIKRSKVFGFDAEEIFLEASERFANTWKRLEYGKKVYSIYGLARKIASRCVCKYIKEKTNREAKQKQYCQDMKACPHLYHQSTETSDESDYLQTDVQQLLKLIPEKYFLAIQLYYLEEKTLAEAGRVLNVVPCTVSRYRDRGIAILRKHCRGMQDS